MIIIAVVGFVISGLCGVYRLLIGPTLADRVVALDLLLVTLMSSIVVDAVRRDDTTYLVVPVVLAIIGFAGTVAACRFIEDGRGSMAEVSE